MDVQIEKANLDSIVKQRINYLSSLAEPQELYIEQMIKLGTVWRISDLGYAITFEDRLIEIHLPSITENQLIEVFQQLKQSSGIDSILYKSFDRQLAQLANLQNVTNQTVGYLFRKFSSIDLSATHPTLVFRPSIVKDLDQIKAINDDFFEDFLEIQAYHQDSGLFSLTTETGNLVGCGITTKVISDRLDVDLGMLVAQDHRSKGIGAYIINQLATLCISRGERPICGCSSDNRASFLALNKAGFTSEHQNLLVKTD